MKKLFTLLLFLSIGVVYAQRNQLPANLVKFVTTERPDYREIEGSPYEHEEFSTGYIYLKEGKTLKIPLRRNLFAETFEMKEGDQIKELVTSEKIEKIVYAGNVYKMVKFRTPEDKVYKDFLQVLVDGNHRLYKRKYVEFMEEFHPKKAYDEYQPPRFEDRDDQYYLKKDQEEAGFISTFNKKKFLKSYYKSRYKELFNWVKENKINLRREQELIRLIEHVNTNG